MFHPLQRAGCSSIGWSVPPSEGDTTGDVGFAGDRRVDPVLHRGSHPIADPATAGLHADLFEDIDAESLVASIGFAVEGLDFLEDHSLQLKTCSRCFGRKG